MHIQWVRSILLAAACAASASCSRPAPPLEPLGPDLEPAREIFAFQLGMSPAEFHDAVYRVPNFQRPDGSRLWFGGINSACFQARCQRVESGRPRMIEAFFSARKATQITISYFTANAQDRADLFARLHRQAVDGMKRVQDCSDGNNGTLYFLEGPGFCGWLANPPQEYDPIRISLSPGVRRHESGRESAQ